MDKFTIRKFFDEVLDSSKDLEELFNVLDKDIICNVDGYYVYWPESSRGYLDDYHLMLIAAVLNKKNRDWDDDIESYFEQKQLESESR